MSAPTPADTLRRAAEKLRSLTAFLGDNRGPWYVALSPRAYPQSIRNKGVPYLVADCHEDPSIPVFTIAPYIAAMHPGVGAALADWLESTADAMGLWAPYQPHENGYRVWTSALATARQILGEGDQP